jgi:hypothetical protein
MTHPGHSLCKNIASVIATSAARTLAPALQVQVSNLQLSTIGDCFALLAMTLDVLGRGWMELRW